MFNRFRHRPCGHRQGGSYAQTILRSPSDGAALGLRWKRDDWALTAAAWALHAESKLIHVGDAGFTEASGATRRARLELLVDLRPSSRWDLTTSHAATHARFTGDPPEGDRIPNAVGAVWSAGASWKVGKASTLSLTWRRLGAAQLIEDNSVRSRPTSLVNALFVHNLGPASVMVEVLNLTKSKRDDIAYVYGSLLQSEPVGGVDDVHFHPVEPRNLRAGLKISF